MHAQGEHLAQWGSENRTTRERRDVGCEELGFGPIGPCERLRRGALKSAVSAKWLERLVDAGLGHSVDIARDAADIEHGWVSHCVN